MLVKTSRLKDSSLDWAVSKALGLDWYYPEYGDAQATYSTNWSHGGPIVVMAIDSIQKWVAVTGDGNDFYEAKVYPMDEESPVVSCYGPTMLIAAMRCYVASRLGDEVDIPEELLSV